MSHECAEARLARAIFPVNPIRFLALILVDNRQRMLSVLISLLTTLYYHINKS